MVKLTGPLQSLSASGTLNNQIQFRKTAQGTTAAIQRTQRPRTTLFLRSNQAITTLCHVLMNEIPVDPEGLYGTYAKQKGISLFNAYLHFALKRWAATTPPPHADPNGYNSTTPGRAAIAKDTTYPLGRAHLHATILDPTFDFVTIHHATNVETPKAATCFAAFHITQMPVTVAIPLDLQPPAYYRVAAWLLAGTTPRTGPSLHWTL